MPTKTRRPARKVSAAKRAEIDAARTEKVDQLGKDLEAAVASLDNETQWVDFLDYLTKAASKYSIGNQMLIWSEGARRGFTPRLVQAHGAWERAGHAIAKGEKAIWIYGPIMRRLNKAEADAREAQTGRRIPRNDQGGSRDKFLVGFKPVPVFDASQVADPENVVLPEPIVRRRMVSGPMPELLTGDDPTGALADIERMIKERDLELIYVDAAQLGGANGRTNGVKVEIRNDVDKAQTIKTAVHELAHNMLGHVGGGERRGGLTRGQREAEAESTAYVVLGALGFDTGAYSAPYVATWSEGNVETIRTALTEVSNTVKAILTALDPGEQDGEDGDPATAA
jgi:hypothetical protein